MLFIIIRFKIRNPEQNPWLWFIWVNIKESSSILEPPTRLYPPPPPPPPPFPQDWASLTVILRLSRLWLFIPSIASLIDFLLLKVTNLKPRYCNKKQRDLKGELWKKKKKKNRSGRRRKRRDLIVFCLLMIWKRRDHGRWWSEKHKRKKTTRSKRRAVEEEEI